MECTLSWKSDDKESTLNISQGWILHLNSELTEGWDLWYHTCTVLGSPCIPIVARSTAFTLEPCCVTQAIPTLASDFITIFKD